MNEINTDDVLQLLEVIRESTIDELCLELPPLKLQVNRKQKAQGDIDGEASGEEEGWVPIKAPVLGFARMSPLAEVNRVVNKDTTLCTIDVLGELHDVNTDYPCRIKKIFITDGQMVEFHQQIFSLEKIEQR